MSNLEGYRTYIGGICAFLIAGGKLGYDWYLGNPTDFEHLIQWGVIGWIIIFGRKAIAKLDVYNWKKAIGDK